MVPWRTKCACFAFLVFSLMTLQIQADEKKQGMPGDAAQKAGGEFIEASITQIASNPEKFVGSWVSVIGLVDDVCPVRGCWANIKDPQGEKRVRFKVPDGELVFTAQMIGDVVKAQGLFARYTMNDAGRHHRNMQKEYEGEATYMLEGRDADLICSENELTSI